MNKVLVAVYCVYGAFCLGLAINQVTTDITKYMVGRLRPHFIEVCKPNWNMIQCNHPQTNQPQYVDDPDICTGTGDLKEAR